MTRSYSPVFDRVVEDHEVVDEDLVHAADRLEGVELVLRRLGGDVAGFGGELLAERMDPLAVRLEDPCDRILGEPIDLEVRLEVPQFGRDRGVAHGMAKSDRGGDVQGAPAPRERPRPRARVVLMRASPPYRTHKVADQQVRQHRVARWDQVVRPVDDHQPPPGQLREPGARGPVGWRSSP